MFAFVVFDLVLQYKYVGLDIRPNSINY